LETPPKIELEFGCVRFLGEGKPGVPGEKPLGARTRTNDKLNPHMTASSGGEPGPQWWEASALAIAPSLLPWSCGFCYTHQPKTHSSLVSYAAVSGWPHNAPPRN